MLKYNICFIKRGDEILLLNREKGAWMGAWNGVGGKLEPHETPRASVLREVEEETGIVLQSVEFRGAVTWTVDQKPAGGMYLYLAELPNDYVYETPLKVAEGLLDWKKIDWILHPNNQGLAHNNPRTIKMLLEERGCYQHHCIYVDDRLIHMDFMAAAPEIEHVADSDKLEHLLFDQFGIDYLTALNK
ncbi:8-oxo-dGTP diphosphatase [Paenibacillus sp. HB172176]|uniref:NUDIX hydrolase n=1 Tax=Paenibacillus sp. HB172176 TaxID=2493690 RepID=UPI001439AB17|nr:8-oxo-dGTP diphosphatase [Paenibacillus sp. HB172176]